VDAGRDVTTDLTPWQKQALGQTEMFAIRQGFRRHHPTRTLSTYSSSLLNGKNPKMTWEKAIDDETKRTEIPQAYKKAQNQMMVNQIGLVKTALENYQKSENRMQMTNMVGI